MEKHLYIKGINKSNNYENYNKQDVHIHLH
jgi:hypothetical protein